MLSGIFPHPPVPAPTQRGRGGVLYIHDHKPQDEAFSPAPREWGWSECMQMLAHRMNIYSNCLAQAEHEGSTEYLVLRVMPALRGLKRRA